MSKVWCQKDHIQQLVESKDNIYAANNEISEEVSSKRRRLGNGKEKYKLVNDAIIIWYKQMRDKNVPIDGVILSEKAKFFAKEFGLNDFLASQGNCRFHLRVGVYPGLVILGILRVF